MRSTCFNTSMFTNSITPMFHSIHKMYSLLNVLILLIHKTKKTSFFNNKKSIQTKLDNSIVKFDFFTRTSVSKLNHKIKGQENKKRCFNSSFSFKKIFYYIQGYIKCHRDLYSTRKICFELVNYFISLTRLFLYF